MQITLPDILRPPPATQPPISAHKTKTRAAHRQPLLKILVAKNKISKRRRLVILRSLTLINVDEHVMQQINAGEDDLALIELSDVLDGKIVKMALNCTDLIVEHESVDEDRTDLTKEDRRYILRCLCCQVKEDTLLTALSCEKCKAAVELLIGIS